MSAGELADAVRHVQADHVRAFQRASRGRPDRRQQARQIDHLPLRMSVLEEALMGLAQAVGLDMARGEMPPSEGRKSMTDKQKQSRLGRRRRRSPDPAPARRDRRAQLGAGRGCRVTTSGPALRDRRRPDHRGLRQHRPAQAGPLRSGLAAPGAQAGGGPLRRLGVRARRPRQCADLGFGPPVDRAAMLVDDPARTRARPGLRPFARACRMEGGMTRLLFRRLPAASLLSQPRPLPRRRSGPATWTAR